MLTVDMLGFEADSKTLQLIQSKLAHSNVRTDCVMMHPDLLAKFEAKGLPGHTVYQFPDGIGPIETTLMGILVHRSPAMSEDVMVFLVDSSPAPVALFFNFGRSGPIPPARRIKL